jgi:hypothetical protein
MAKTALQISFAAVKKFLPRAIWSPMRAIATAAVAPVRFSATTGHWKSSLKTSACSASGEPIPWYTYPAIDFLAQRDFSSRNVLEFGGGQSTLWWSRRAQSVLTIEEDAAWSETLRRRIGSNVTLHHVPINLRTRDTSLLKDVLDKNPISRFDIVVVDGHLREEIMPLAFDRLAADGAMIIDNAEGYGFYDALKARDCSRIDFFGFAPGVVLRHCTSVVFRGDCFLLKPDIPIANIESTDH